MSEHEFTPEQIQAIAREVVGILAEAEPVSPESPTRTVAALPADEYAYTREPEALPDRTKLMREALANLRQAAFQVVNAQEIAMEDQRAAGADLSLSAAGVKDVMERMLGVDLDTDVTP